MLAGEEGADFHPEVDGDCLLKVQAGGVRDLNRICSPVEGIGAAGAAVPVVCRAGAVNGSVVIKSARIVGISVERIIGDHLAGLHD